jgi:hypothetical protein
MIVTITALNKNPKYAYKVSITGLRLFAPDEEQILSDSHDVNGIPHNKNEISFKIELGPCLQEKIEKCKSKNLELEFKLVLDLDLSVTSELVDGWIHCNRV